MNKDFIINNTNNQANLAFVEIDFFKFQLEQVSLEPSIGEKTACLAMCQPGNVERSVFTRRSQHISSAENLFINKENLSYLFIISIQLFL